MITTTPIFNRTDTPCPYPALFRSVDQVQVYLLELQPLQALLEGLQHAVGALRVVPQLGGDENLLAFHASRTDARTDAFLVVVDRCGVDMAVARLQCGAHRQCRLVVRGLPDAEPALRNGMAVIAFYGSLGRHGLLHGSYGWGPDDRAHMAGGKGATSDRKSG